ncbi:MAG TPA: DUF2336 domain-containing protein [Methylobacterium sp.]|jgi:hypothetical protein
MIAALISDVERAVAGGDAPARTSMLRRVTSLFTETAERLGEAQVDAFDIVLLRLSQRVATPARVDLSETLADIPNAPPRAVRDLAFDPDATVAAPVLARSARLAEGDLIQIAQALGPDHLKAIARRRTLSERVTDVLVVRGDREVVRTAAGNGGARFSDGGFDALAQHARKDAVLATVIEARPDLPARHKARTGPPAAASAPTLSAEERAAATAIGAAEAALGGLAVDLDEKQVAAWLSEGKAMEAAVAVARLAGVPSAMAVQAYQAPDYDPLLFLVRSIRFGWGTFKLFLQSKPGKAAAPEDMRGAFEAFQALSVPTAQRVVRFNAARDWGPKTGAA